MNLPVLVEPVVNLSFGIKRISEIAGTGGSDPVHWTISCKQVVGEFLVLAVVILLHNSKVAHRLAYKD